FDAVWEGKVVERILHNLSLLMNQSFKTVQELNRYRKELGREIAGAIAVTPAATDAKPQAV
ncbi:MAG: ferritin-like domain-containing protein, partial [Vitreoscilla sp.]|nr:ferritin-like domain-containing protein [Polaromonas sp.]